MKHRIMLWIMVFGFLLGCHQGYIALWKDGQTEPVKVFPYRITSLPASDQQALLDGIHIEDPLALSRLLEDYLS